MSSLTSTSTAASTATTTSTFETVSASSSSSTTSTSTSTSTPTPSTSSSFSIDTTISDENQARAFENQYVHTVYDVIAPHFSSTRHSMWPQVRQFLSEFPVGSIIADCGCGNGKYTHVPGTEYANGCYIMGTDISANLISICASRGCEVSISSGLAMPYRSLSCDGVLSIAVIHHFVTSTRRAEAVSELFRILRVGGKMIIYVWSYEEGGQRKNGAPDSQEVYIPWNLQKRFQTKAVVSAEAKAMGAPVPQINATQYLRYYHLFKKGELEDLIHTALADDPYKYDIINAGFDHENWFVIVQKGERKDTTTSKTSSKTSSASASASSTTSVTESLSTLSVT